MDISFYFLKGDSFLKTVARLVEKAYASQARMVVFDGVQERLEEIDKVLWTFSTDAFIPHGSKELGHETLQAVWLTDKPENPNNSTILLLINDFDLQSWADLGFSRVLIAFSDELRKKADSELGRLKKESRAVTYWSQTDKGWDKR